MKTIHALNNNENPVFIFRHIILLYFKHFWTQNNYIYHPLFRKKSISITRNMGTYHPKYVYLSCKICISIMQNMYIYRPIYVHLSSEIRISIIRIMYIYHPFCLKLLKLRLHCMYTKTLFLKWRSSLDTFS